MLCYARITCMYVCIINSHNKHHYSAASIIVYSLLDVSYLSKTTIGPATWRITKNIPIQRLLAQIFVRCRCIITLRLLALSSPTNNTCVEIYLRRYKRIRYKICRRLEVSVWLYVIVTRRRSGISEGQGIKRNRISPEWLVSVMCTVQVTETNHSGEIRLRLIP